MMMTHRSELGLSLLELLASMFSMLIVASMAFHLLLTSNRSVNQHLSMASRGDRLRLLQTLLERELAARFPDPLSASTTIGSITGPPVETSLIAADVLLQGDTDTVDLGHVTYQIQYGLSGEEKWDLVRRVEPFTGSEGVTTGTQTILFSIEPAEFLTLSATREITSPTRTHTRLIWRFLDERYRDHPVTREMVLAGGGVP